jgi:hypothetical protein
VTVPPGDDKGGRPTKGEETSASDAEVSPGHSKRKEGKPRAILRAPELVQSLYREGLVTQATAAKLGPKRPTPERAARVVEARQPRQPSGSRRRPPASNIATMAST